MFRFKPRRFWITKHKDPYQIDLDRVVPDYVQIDVRFLHRFIKKRFETNIVQKINNAAEVLWILDVNGQRISIYQDWVGVNIHADGSSSEKVMLDIIDHFRSSKKFIEEI